jgi:hypothetical protein
MLAISLLLFSAGCESAAPPEDGIAVSRESSAAAPNPDTEPAAAETEAAETGETTHENGFAFVYNGEAIYMGEYIDGVVERLGPALDYIESESCTSAGMMKTYYYGGVEISAYAKTETDEYRIFSIILADDSVTTAEGLYIGHTQSDMVAAYGTDFQSLPGVFQYTKNGTGLKFDLEGEEIICITYTLLNI